MKKEYIKLPIDDLIPYENNPRKNEDAIPAVAESIEQVGYISPIVIDENNVILCGHTRLAALQKIGEVQEIDVLRVSGLSEEKKKKFRLLDNKTSEFAGWDFEKLDEELDGLDFGDFDFKFDANEFNDDEEKPKTESINYKDNISVVIDCDNEEEAEKIFMTLQEEEYKCRISTL